MNYDEMVKEAYEDIVDSFEKEAANRLYRDGVSSVTDLIEKRQNRLASPVRQLDSKLADPNLASPWQRHFNKQRDQLLSERAVRNAYNRPRFSEGYAPEIDSYNHTKALRGFSKKFEDMYRNSEGWLKTVQMRQLNALSNHGRTLDDIKKDAWRKMRMQRPAPQLQYHPVDADTLRDRFLRYKNNI